MSEIWIWFSHYTLAYFLHFMMEMWDMWEFSHNWDQQSHNQAISSRHGIDQITLHILSGVTQRDVAWHPSHSWHTRHHLITPVQHCSHLVLDTATLRHFKSQNLVKTTGKIWILSWDTWQTLDRAWHLQQHRHQVSQKTPSYLIRKLSKNKRVFLVGSKYRWSPAVSVISTEISRPLLLSFFNLHHTSCVIVCFYLWVDTFTPEQG